jgi:hypothetical protein
MVIQMKFNKVTETSTVAFSVFDYACGALLLGSLWGFFEVFLKDVLRMGSQPYTSAVMTGVGVMIMAAGYGLYRKAWIAPATAISSIFARMIIVPVLGCSPICSPNSVIALVLLGTWTGAAFFAFSKSNRVWHGGLCVGAGTLLSGITFYYAGMACAPCQYLHHFQKIGGLSAFLAMEVAYWTIAAMMLFYPGHAVGMRLSNIVEMLKDNRPLPYYAGILCASFIFIMLIGLIVAQ